MNSFFKIRLYITGFVTIAIWGLLAWEYTHGGFQSHHILRRKDLPELQNWWGGIMLPVLTWFLLNRIQKRPESLLSQKVIYGFLGAFTTKFGSSKPHISILFLFVNCSTYRNAGNNSVIFIRFPLTHFIQNKMLSSNNQ